MKNEQRMDNETITAAQLATEIEITRSAVKYRADRLGIIPVQRNGDNIYTVEQANKIKSYKHSDAKDNNPLRDVGEWSIVMDRLIKRHSIT